MNITFITSLYFADLKSKCLQIFLISQVLLQKQPPEVFCKKTCIQKSLKIHRKKLKPPTLSKKRLWHECFPKNFAKFLRTLFLQNPPDGCFCSYSALLLMLLLSQNIKAQFIKIVTFVILLVALLSTMGSQRCSENCCSNHKIRSEKQKKIVASKIPRKRI